MPYLLHVLKPVARLRSLSRAAAVSGASLARKHRMNCRVMGAGDSLILLVPPPRKGVTRQSRRFLCLAQSATD